ncbi:unnamed protein product [Adineta ricciae]|uniref:Uncharacterized protein n=1 Tax=Adineta ricciae TaxID=249248 RepID=A0A815DSC0_ADIRI|nr:unnamed protein product [Adineta ricciae]CAF1297470.1 unnamed protein product [Adineta ricciae]
MYFFSLGLLAIFCTCSLVLATPIDYNVDEKQEKLITTANRLLDELAREQAIHDDEQENDNVGYLVVNNSFTDEDEPQADGILLDNDKELIKYLKNLQYFNQHFSRTARDVE